GVLRQLAVELDTYKNEYKSDPDGNHIAIDTVSIQDPVIVKSLESTGIDLKSGKDITVQIRYDGWKKVLQISVAYTGEPLIEFINQRIIMKKTVPKQVYIGFTGATGLAQESHHVINWNFTSSDLPEKSLKTATGLGKKEIFQSLQKKGQLLKCVDKNLEGKFNVNQVTRVLMVGLACLHPGSSLRPTMRKVAQVFLNPDEPLMSMPTSRPLVVTLSFSSSTTNSARGETSTISLQSLPDERAITRNPSCSDET
ncbi:probable L-type lectin-domain containing receptor kinase S.5, partial [Tanacetum coccineum]